MYKSRLPSIEKFAAFLDGNLPDNEMKQMSDFAHRSKDFQEMLQAGSIIDDTIESYNDGLLIPEEILNPDNSFLEKSDLEEEFFLNEDLLESQTDNSYHSYIEDAQTQYGLEPLNIEFDPDTYQWEQDTCAIRSQEIVLRSYGIFVPQSDLISQASVNGWYTPGEGTGIEEVGNLLNLYNIPNHRVEHANVFNLVDELGQGHKVIVGVDIDELYGNSFWQAIRECLVGKTPNHAMIVSGIDTSDISHIKVILTDPGTGKTLFECPFDKFLSAWNDSDCFMVATDNPAPLQYNQESMINFDYERGHISYLGKMPFEHFHQYVVPSAERYLDDIEGFIDSLSEVVDDELISSGLLADAMDKATESHTKASVFNSPLSHYDELGTPDERRCLSFSSTVDEPVDVIVEDDNDNDDNNDSFDDAIYEL